MHKNQCCLPVRDCCNNPKHQTGFAGRTLLHLLIIVDLDAIKPGRDMRQKQLFSVRNNTENTVRAIQRLELRLLAEA